MNEGVQSSQLLQRLRNTMAEASEGQERLDKLTSLIATSLGAEVCSIYLRREDRKLELCATHGLSSAAVHQTIMNASEGLVGRVAESGKTLNTMEASKTRGFSYRPETDEDQYQGFCGVPIQRLGRVQGVLVVQTAEKRLFGPEAVSALEIIAIVIAEMSELGHFSSGELGGAMTAPRNAPQMFRGVIAQEGVARGEVIVHNPSIQIENPVADDPSHERERIEAAFLDLDRSLGQLKSRDMNEETQEILQTFESFSRDKGFRRRLLEDIDQGLTAEAAVEVEQSRLRARMSKITDPYLRERMSDIDDLCNRLIRILVGRDASERKLPENAILVARNLGPAELMDYGRGIKGIILSEGSVGAHATIIARAWSIPLIIQAKNIHYEARDGDLVLVDAEQGVVHLRPDESVDAAFKDKLQMSKRAAAAYDVIRDLPAITKDGVRVRLKMNAGLLADLPSLMPSGAEGVGLFRTELQFLARQTVPRRNDMSDLYAHVMDAAGDKPVTFRTLDIGSDKILPKIRAEDEPNPAMGWRAIRMGLDRPNILKMQMQCLLRGAKGRDLRIMFPFITQRSEFDQAKSIFNDVYERHVGFRHLAPKSVELGAMLETPSLAFAPDSFFQAVDFISVGGNDLKMFFFAADRENERVRKRYDSLNTSYLSFLGQLSERCLAHNNMPMSFCGEDAGKPLEALAFVAMGFRFLSMRPASIGQVKHIIRQVDLGKVREVIDKAMREGDQSVRGALTDYLAKNGVTYRRIGDF